MKLHDAMRKTVREYGVRVISEKRLIFILADLRAFEEYPAVKPVLENIVSGGAGKELVRLFLEDDRDWFLSYAGNLKKSLSGKSRFREDLADYAVGSILFALGAQDTVTEPSDHGFDPMEHGSSVGNPGAGGRKDLREKEDKAGAEGNAGGGAGEWGAGVTGREHSGEKIPEPYGSRQEASGSVSAAPLHAWTKDYSKGMKWVIAAALIAGGFAWGSLVTGSSHEKEQAASSQRTEDIVAPHDSAASGLSDVHDEDQAAEPLTAGSEISQDSGAEPGQYEYEQGQKYYYGNGDERNYENALAWYLKAADKGHSGAEFSIGLMYELGTGVAQNYELALGWYLKAAAHGNQDAQARIGHVEKLLAGRAGGNDSVETLGAPDSRAAESHDGEYEYKEGEKGQYEYEEGEKYYYGRGTDMNYAKAFDWYRKAADKEHSGAEYRIGWMYEHGEGVDRDYQAALNWYRWAAGHGSGIARKGIERVGKLISGQGGDHDAGDAQGASDARDEASRTGEYEYAEREKRYSRLDYAGALQWCLKAAEKGHSGAECSIGWIYEQGGNGVGRDYQKAMDWYRRAAAHGSRAAQLRLRTDRAAR